VAHVLFIYAQRQNEEGVDASSSAPRFVFKLTLYIHALSCLLYMIHNIQFGNTGTGNVYANTAGDVIWCLGELGMMTVIFLTAKGLGVFRSTISTSTMMKMAAFFLIYLIGFMIVLRLERKTFDPKLVTFRYDSDFGEALNAMYFVGLFTLLYATYTTLQPKDENDRPADGGDHTNPVCPESKKKFFFVFGITYACWFLFTPISVYSLIKYGQPFQRANVALTCSEVRKLGGHLILLILWAPKYAGEYFPFTKSISSVGVAGDDPVIQSPEDELISSRARAMNNASAIVNRRSLFSSALGPDDLDLSMQSTSQDEIDELTRRTLALQMRKGIAGQLDNGKALALKGSPDSGVSSTNSGNGNDDYVSHQSSTPVKESVRARRVEETAIDDASANGEYLEVEDSPVKADPTPEPEPEPERAPEPRRSSASSKKAAAKQQASSKKRESTTSSSASSASALGALPALGGGSSSLPPLGGSSSLAPLKGKGGRAADAPRRMSTGPPPPSYSEDADNAEVPVRPIGGTGAIRGVCGQCNEPVYSSQERNKDKNGVYFHAKPEECG